ncbi:MAG: type II secretion system F family protein [Betaproteobacteria bacterium]|nr:type II secretion system F family protein [Betaproteobacteria bacterium]
MRFEIKAYRPGEGVISLFVDAATAEEAGSHSSGLGFAVVSVRPTGRFEQFRRREPPFDLLQFTQELRSLLTAGLSLIESLGALARKEQIANKRRLIEALIHCLREGKAFSAALRELPAEIPPLYLALMGASEQTGDLPGALGRYIEYRSQMDALQKRVSSAAIYPALLLSVGGVVIAFLMGYVVPRFSLVYEDFGNNLPFLSRLLLQWGKLIEAHGSQILIGLGLGVALVVVFIRRRQISGREIIARLLDLKLFAGLRQRIRVYSLARFYRTTGLLLEGGIPVVTALGMARDLLSEDMREALDRSLASIRGGIALSEALQEGDLTPPVAADLLRIGEKTGDMGEKMIRIADFHDEETQRWADWFVRLFEPLLMLFIGLFIAFIVVLLYMPIFELAGTLQ